MRIKKYLSYSQYKAFYSGQYEKRYIQGIQLDNDGIRFGKKFAEFMESDEIIHEDSAISLAKLSLPTPQVKEAEFLVEYENIPLFGKLDGLDIDPLLNIHEYKTGSTPWTQNMVDKDEQLTFYAIFIYIKYKRLPDNIHLYWLERNGDTLTGKIKIFKTTRTLKDIIKIYPKIKNAWIGIEKIIDECAKSY